MSEMMINNLLELVDSIDKHLPDVEKKMRNSGREFDPLVAISIAKYWPALEKLAAE